MPRFAKRLSAKVNAGPLDDCVHYCSIRSIYWMLDRDGEARERGGPIFRWPKPPAEGPNEVYSRGISKLMDQRSGVTFCLCVIPGSLNRRVLGWCVAETDRGSLFGSLPDDAIAQRSMLPGQLTLTRRVDET